MDDIPEYTAVQRVLREEIVNPLRKKLFVRADKVMKLRQFLDDLTSAKDDRPPVPLAIFKPPDPTKQPM